MAIDYNALAIPKGRTVKQRRAKAKREDAAKLKAFRDACWKRERDKFQPTEWNVDPESAEYADCQSCGAVVTRHHQPDDLLTGEVHHRISRRHKATRYNPDNGVLLCNHLVNNCHARAESGEIDV